MRFCIYLKIEGDKLHFNVMEPKDTLTYEFTREVKIEDVSSDTTQGKLIKLNKIENFPLKLCKAKKEKKTFVLTKFCKYKP